MIVEAVSMIAEAVRLTMEAIRLIVEVQLVPVAVPRPIVDLVHPTNTA